MGATSRSSLRIVQAPTAAAEFLLLLHINTVIVWLGAGFTMDLLFLRAERTGNRMARFYRTHRLVASTH
jgi:hypothetical protein